MPPYRRLRMPSSSESSSSESSSPTPTEAPARKPKSVEVKSEMVSHDEGDDGDSFSNTQVSQAASKRKRKPDPPPGAARSIPCLPCLPCIARAVKNPGHQCHDCNANEAAWSDACWHCSYINRHRKTCVELPAEMREELMEFWNMNSKLPKDYVRDASEQANVARINRMLYEYRNRSGRPRPSRGGDPISQAGIPSEPAAERPVAGEPVDIRESIASQPIARDFTASQPMAREPVFVRTPAAEPGFIPLVQQNIRPVNVMGDSENALAAMIREQTAAMNRQTEVMEGIFASLQNISSQMATLTTEVRRHGQGRISAAGQAGNNINRGVPSNSGGQIRDDGMDAWQSEYLARWKK